MLKDFFVANSNRLITNQLLDEIHGKGGDFWFCWKLKELLMLEDLLACAGGIIREEGRITNQHLEHDDSNTPPIDTFVVALLNEDFWGDVVGSAYCGKCFLKIIRIIDLLLFWFSFVGTFWRRQVYRSGVQHLCIDQNQTIWDDLACQEECCLV